MKKTIILSIVITLFSTPIFIWGQTYDRQKAVEYARKYVKPGVNGGRHPDYYNPNYNTEYGSDCANFASQILYEGGLPFSPTPVPNTDYVTHRSYYYYFQKYWYQARSTDGIIFNTKTWSSVDFLYLRLESGYENVQIITVDNPSLYSEVVKIIKIGDLIFFDSNKDEKMDHVAVITEINRGIMYYTGHTSDRDNISLTSLMFNQGSKWSFIFAHIKDPPPRIFYRHARRK